MSKRKGSKNAIENRGIKSTMRCDVCTGTKKPIRLVGAGKKKMVYECECGIKTKAGEFVIQ